MGRRGTWARLSLFWKIKRIFQDNFFPLKLMDKLNSSFWVNQLKLEFISTVASWGNRLFPPACRKAHYKVISDMRLRLFSNNCENLSLVFLKVQSTQSDIDNVGWTLLDSWMFHPFNLPVPGSCPPRSFKCTHPPLFVPTFVGVFFITYNKCNYLLYSEPFISNVLNSNSTLPVPSLTFFMLLTGPGDTKPRI